MLHPEHPDFSPSEDCTPRRLFAPLGKGKARAKTQGQVPTPQRRSPSPAWDDDGEDDSALAGPPRATLAQEFERIGKADGKKLPPLVNEGKANAGTAALPKEGTKVATSKSKSGEIPT